MAARNREAILRFLDIFMVGFIGKLVIRELHQNAVTKVPHPTQSGIWGMSLHIELFPVLV